MLHSCPAGRSLFPILGHSTSGLARFSKRRRFLKPATYPRLRLLSKISRIDSAESPKRAARVPGWENIASLKELIERADSHERPILLRLLHNELRIGLHDGLIQEAIARASGSDLKAVRRAALFLSGPRRGGRRRAHRGNDRPSAGRYQTFRSASSHAFRAVTRFRRNLYSSRRKNGTGVQVRRGQGSDS